VDRGLLDRWLTVESQQTGTSVSQLRAGAVDNFTGDPELSALPQGEQIRAALIAFVKNGGRISVPVQPPERLNLIDLPREAQQEPTAMLARLGLTLAHNASPVAVSSLTNN
jgi:hypothetical protein